MIKQIISENAPSAPQFLSQAIESNGFVFVSGQIHNTPDGTLIEDSVEQKLKQIMTNIANILEDGGFDFNQIIKATIYVTDMSQMAEINNFYPKFFGPGPLPARESVCVKELPLGATIEISVIAEA